MEERADAEHLEPMPCAFWGGFFQNNSDSTLEVEVQHLVQFHPRRVYVSEIVSHLETGTWH